MANDLSISLHFNKAQLADLTGMLEGLKFKGHPASAVAVQRAISNTITTGVKLIAQRIGEEVHLPQRTIKGTITVRRGSFREPRGYITLRRIPVKLIDFVPKRTVTAMKSRFEKMREGMSVRRRGSAGITVNVRKRGSGKYGTRQTFPHAFYAQMPDGYLGIFERKGKQRLPITAKKGPTPLGIFVHARGQAGAHTVMAETEEKLREALAKNLSSQLDYFLAQRAAAIGAGGST